jgi:hypothetical protein
MARRDLSGHNDEALADPTADARELITGANFDGESATFHLRGLWFYNADLANDAVIELFDQDEGVAVALNGRGVIACPAGVTTVVSFEEPGIMFRTNLTAGINGGVGTVAAFQALAWGYLEGGQ